MNCKFASHVSDFRNEKYTACNIDQKNKCKLICGWRINSINQSVHTYIIRDWRNVSQKFESIFTYCQQDSCSFHFCELVILALSVHYVPIFILRTRIIICIKFIMESHFDLVFMQNLVVKQRQSEYLKIFTIFSSSCV